MKTDKAIEPMGIEEMIQVLQTMYPKTCKMVDGRLKGGFDNHDCKEGQALDGAIGALEEMAKLKSLSESEFSALKTEIQKQICQTRQNADMEDQVSRLICKAKIQAFGCILDNIKEQELKLGIIEPKSTDEEIDEMIKSIPDVLVKQNHSFWDKVEDNGENSFAWNTIKRFHDGKAAVMTMNKEEWRDFINKAERIEGIHIPPEHRKFVPSFSREQYGYIGKMQGKFALCREFYRSRFPTDMELISAKSFIQLANKLPLAPKPKEMNVPGHMGTFKSIDDAEIKNNGEVMTCCLMESVEYGQDANMVVINGDGQLIAQDITSEDVCNWKDIATDCLSCSSIYPISIEKDREPDLE